jgi:hypothetical protein
MRPKPSNVSTVGRSVGRATETFGVNDVIDFKAGLIVDALPEPVNASLDDSHKVDDMRTAACVDFTAMQKDVFDAVLAAVKSTSFTVGASATDSVAALRSSTRVSADDISKIVKASVRSALAAEERAFTADNYAHDVYLGRGKKTKVCDGPDCPKDPDTEGFETLSQVRARRLREMKKKLEDEDAHVARRIEERQAHADKEAMQQIEDDAKFANDLDADNEPERVNRAIHQVDMQRRLEEKEELRRQRYTTRPSSYAPDHGIPHHTYREDAHNHGTPHHMHRENAVVEEILRKEALANRAHEDNRKAAAQQRIKDSTKNTAAIERSRKNFDTMLQDRMRHKEAADRKNPALAKYHEKATTHAFAPSTTLRHDKHGNVRVLKGDDHEYTFKAGREDRMNAALGVAREDRMNAALGVAREDRMNAALGVAREDRMNAAMGVAREDRMNAALGVAREDCMNAALGVDREDRMKAALGVAREDRMNAALGVAREDRMNAALGVARETRINDALGVARQGSSRANNDAVEYGHDLIY